MDIVIIGLAIVVMIYVASINAQLQKSKARFYAEKRNV